MSQQAVGFHHREVNRRMAEMGMPAAAWSPEKIAYIESMKAAAYLWEAERAAKYRAEIVTAQEEADHYYQRYIELCDLLEKAEAALAKVNESPYSPAFRQAIADSCSTPASRNEEKKDGQ